MFNPLTIKGLNYKLCCLVIILTWQIRIHLTEVRPVKGLVLGPSWPGKKPRLGVPSPGLACLLSLSCRFSICKRPWGRKRKRWGSLMGTSWGNLNTEETVEGCLVADPPTTRSWWAVATLTLAWVMGMIGDRLHTGYWVQQAGVDGAAGTKTPCNPLWVIQALELCGQLCQQGGGSNPFLEETGAFGSFLPPLLSFVMAASEYKAKRSYALCLYGFVFSLSKLLSLSHLSSRERLTAVTQASFHLFISQPILVSISSCLCMETSFSQWFRTSKPGRAVEVSSCCGLSHCPQESLSGIHSAELQGEMPHLPLQERMRGQTR